MANPQWTNWSGHVSCNPSEISYPETEEQVVEIVQKAIQNNQKIRILGRGHSFSQLVQTNDIIVCLDKLSGLIEINNDKTEATVWAGTQIKELGGLLFEHGLAQENLGDIDVQSIAGATATGTHGTGVKFGNIATQITGMTLVNGKGELVQISKTENPEWLNAAQISLGTLGIITRISIRCCPTYNLKIVLKKSTWEETIANLDQLNSENRNFEFYSFPYSETVQHRITNLTTEPAQKDGFTRYFNDIVMENGFFWVLCEMTKRIPSLSQRMSRFISSAAVVTTKINHSHKIFATVRNVKFNEMEYNIPIEYYQDCSNEIKERIEKEQYQVHFPIEHRFVQGDDIWLSPAYQRNSAYIAVHMYKGMPYKKYFEDMEAIFRSYDGRPHWGKMHTKQCNTFEQIYPKWAEFKAVREQFDPNQVFLSSYLKDIFGC